MTSPTVAQGFAAMCVVASAVVGFGVLGSSQASTRPHLPVCPNPVEVVQGVVTTLGCAGDLPQCEGARGGDRVHLDSRECRVDGGRMQAAWRLGLGFPLNLNRATAQELELVPGIGPSLAGAIVDHRTAHGAYTRWSALLAVRGIGPKRLADFRRSLTIFEPPSR